MEVTSGIILGLDTDTDHSADRLIEFIEASQIPILTINLLQALPRTPLFDRLSRDNRITDDPKRDSNVVFLRPYDEVLEAWRRCIAYAYEPERLFARFKHQVSATYANRIIPPAKGKLNYPALRMAAVMAWRLLTRMGLKAEYRRHFWSACWHAAKRGQIDAVMGMGFVAYHMIKFSREAIIGQQNASFYSTKLRADAEPAWEAERVA
jgi:hypothetical protein